MHFYISRPLRDSVIIEANSLEELIFQMSTYGEFRDEDLEKVFSQRRRDRFISNDDSFVSIMRLTNKELKTSRTKICPLCVEDGNTHYIVDDATICDHHILVKFNLYECITYDTADCLGMVDLLPADDVLKILRTLE